MVTAPWLIDLGQGIYQNKNQATPMIATMYSTSILSFHGPILS